MFKKIFLAALAIGAGLFILNHTRLGSYGHTAWNKAKKSVKGQVPIEFEIERVRDQVRQLVPDMRKNIHQIAEEVVAIERLKEEIQVARVNLAKQEELVRVMTDDLKSGNERIRYNGINYTRERISEKLANDIKSCVRCKDELKAKESLLEHKERALDAAREQLASIRSQKEELEVQIAQLEAEVKAVRLQQTKSTIQLDDSRLGDIKRSLQEIKNRLQVEKVRGDLEGQFANDPTIKVEKKKSADEVIKDAEAYFNGGDSQKDSKALANDRK
jgi:chromosome segregation ATPase